MSQLQKLLISGCRSFAPDPHAELMDTRIRSFNNDAGQVIAFEPPLTLIVGTNGSGKTTIIECLKFATIGEQPPNSKGGAFVHDPQLVGEKEVKAQVRLQFIASNGSKMALVRNLQLTVKKTKRSMTTLEANLVLQRAGERTSISSKITHLNEIMPHYLGASRAILDYVIFCHQDESLWPMSEPSALKKRFDEIFEAEKYIKAIDNIRALQKKHRNEIESLKTIEVHAKQDKIRAETAKQTSKKLFRECEVLEEKIAELEEEASNIQEEVTEAWATANSYTKKIEELKSKRKQKEILEDHLNRLAVDFEARPESSEQLQKELDEYEGGLQLLQSRQQEQTGLYENVRKDIRDAQARQSNKRIEAGKYEQQQANHEQRLKEREAEIKRAAREYGIRGFDMDLDDMLISEFMERILKMSKDQTSKVDRLKNENQREMKKVQDVIDNLREKRSALQEGRRSAKEQIDNNNRTISRHHSRLEKFTQDEGSVTALEAKIEELDTKIAEVNHHLVKLDCIARSKKLTKEMEDRDVEGSALNRELIEGTKQASDSATLDHLRKEAKDRERRLQSLTKSNDDALRELLGAHWQDSKLEAGFNKALDKKKAEAATAQRQRDGVSRDLEHAEFKLRTALSDIKQKETELTSCTAFIREKLDVEDAEPDDYPVELAGAQSDRDTAQRDVDGYSSMEKFFKDAIKHIETKQECLLCKSSLGGKRKKEELIGSIQRQFGDAKRQELEQNLQNTKDDLAKLESAGSYYDTWRRLSVKELPSLQNQVTDLKKQRDTLVRHLEEKDEDVKEAEGSQEDVERLSKPVQTIVKYQDELNGFNEKIQKLLSEKEGSGSFRSLDEIREQMEAVKAQEKDLRTKIGKIQEEDRQVREKINNLKQEKGVVSSKLMEARRDLQEKASINSQISDLKEVNIEQKNTFTDLGNQLDALSPQFSEHSAELEDIRKSGLEREKELHKEALRLSDDVQRLFRFEEEIQSYVKRGDSTKLNECRAEIGALETEVSTLETRLKQITVEINKISKQLDKQDFTRRVIVDNLNYRKYQSELKEIAKEIDILARDEATTNQQEAQQKAERLQRKLEVVNIKKSRSLGEKTGKDAELARVESEIDREAGAKHREARVKLEATKAAVEDLGRYHIALDAAIMQFHSIKMEQINRSIEELWRATYQGTDVDTILIRSDNEVPSKTKNDSTRRTYAYRVCMVKDGVEMDMRGRCSAGQKVLASIIIRLALAECFGEYCGLIALDEPTTNLDHDNIESLAQSLHGIISERRKQNNFQIIIITHDEDFLKYMQCQDFCDHYWRVSRNDKQKSVIMRQRISDVMG